MFGNSFELRALNQELYKICAGRKRTVSGYKSDIIGTDAGSTEGTMNTAEINDRKIDILCAFFSCLIDICVGDKIPERIFKVGLCRIFSCLKIEV